MLASASSSTSSRTSTSSSTSEAPPDLSSGRGRGPAHGSRVLGLFRLVHPFPSTLDAVVAGAVALIAGADPLVALRLALAMLALQAGIGTANDLIDAPADAIGKPTKPIPAGLVGERTAERLMMAFLVLGLALSALSGLLVLGIALLGTAVGLVYDMRLKGTAWSWAAFALGVPLLPLFGWVGSGEPVPAAMLVAVVLAIPAGAALAIANTIADIRADASAGRESIATVMGSDRAWAIGAALQAGVLAASVVALLVSGSLVSASGVNGAALAGLVACAATVGLGLILGHSRDPSSAAHGWEMQAVGLACLAVVWLLVMPLRG